MNKINKFWFCFVFLIISIIPVCYADESDYLTIVESRKYYKTIDSVSYEISKLEYDLANVNSRTIGVIETTYKEMTTTISTNGNYYRYKVVLNWKNMPATRSYDIIGIGFLGSVKVFSNLNFKQEYCITTSGCTISTTNYPQIFNYGAGTTFKLPTGDLYSLKQTLYFDVEKNTTNTIILQEAYGDYSHATSSISLTNAKKYTVVSNVGINLNSSISNYYDSINVAKASWSGSW